MSLSVLHVEVGGSYGGSLRALELYLKYSDRSCLTHDLLLYYPTPAADRLRPHLRHLQTLRPAAAAHGQGAGPRRGWRPHPPAAAVEPLMLARQLPLAPELAAAIRASACDVVHCNNSFSYQGATVLAAGWAGVPLAAHVRNPLSGSRCQRWLASRTQLLLALHGGHEGELRGWHLPGAIARCPDGIELPRADGVRVSALRRRFLPHGGVLLGSLGRLEPQKGYASLIAAASVFLGRMPEARLVIFGEGGERERLQLALAQAGLEHRILLAGFAADAASVLAALDLFICPSRWEGLPLCVLEALLSGTPVVATEPALRGEPRLHDFLAAPPARPEAASLAQAVEAALAQPAAAQQRAAAGRAWVATEFAPALAAQRLDAALLRLGHHGPPARAFYEHAYSQPHWRRPAGAGAGARFTKMWYRAALRHVLPRLALRGRRVLEIGAGYGFLAPWFLEQGARYIGLDMAESALRQLPADRPGCHPLLADACRLPFADASFDLVVCMEVFEHIADQEALLGEMGRVAAPGAHWLLSCPNYCNLYLPLKLLADSGNAACRRYINRQPLDRTLFAFRVRRQLARHAEVVEQRAVRLHPPLFERFDQRAAAGRGLSRLNDALFRLEQRCGTWSLIRHCGLHTCFLLRSRGRRAAAGQVWRGDACSGVHSQAQPV